MDASIFISFASQDRKVASTLCKALESRGFKCWLSSRDILPGENFQVAIVRAIRKAKILLLVFTANSNGSEEMTKELALASQEKLIVVPLRIEDVAPSEAFTYEFATRQWIDFFADWEAAIDQLSERLALALPADAVAPVTAKAAAEPVVVAAPPPRPPEPVPPPIPPAHEVKAVVDGPAASKPAPAPAATAARKPSPKPATAEPKGKSRAGLYAAVAAAALVVVALLAAPSLFGRKDATKDHLAAMAATDTAGAAQAGATDAKPLTDGDVAAASAAPRAAAEAAPVVEEPVRVKPRKKAAAAPQPVEDIPY